MLHFFVGKNEDLRLQNRALAAITILFATTGIIWTGVYIALGQALAASVPLVYAAVSLLAVLLLGAKRGSRLFR